jgi:hypothetical protein
MQGSRVLSTWNIRREKCCVALIFEYKITVLCRMQAPNDILQRLLRIKLNNVWVQERKEETKGMFFK